MVMLVNNHVLFPNPANWSQRPRWQRAWQTEVADAVTASESRVGLRPEPRVGLAFLVTPPNQQEQARFDDRTRAAKKSGLACAPYHGRGALLLVEANGDEILTNEGWVWAVGDYCFFRDEDGNYEVRQITSAVLAAGVWTLGFADMLENNYAAGMFVWPLLFGVFSTTDMEIENHIIGPMTVTITERVSSRTAQIGAVIPVAADEFALFKT